MSEPKSKLKSQMQNCWAKLPQEEIALAQTSTTMSTEVTTLAAMASVNKKYSDMIIILSNSF